MEDRRPHTPDVDEHPLVIALKGRLRKHMQQSEQFLDGYWKECVDVYRMYHDARNYRSIRKQSKFPSGFMQEQVDQFVADLRDKLWYTGRPATCVGTRETLKEDAAAKQEMLDYQDQHDKLFSKSGKLLRDATMYKVCWGKVEYDEDYDRRWDVEEYEVPIQHPETGDMIMDPQTGMPAMDQKSEWVLKDVPIYKGPRVSRVDPVKVYFTKNKREINDGEPIAIREYVPKSYFDKPYFINTERLGDPKGSGDTTTDDNNYTKRVMLGYRPDEGAGGGLFMYDEMFILVNQRKLYEFLEVDEEKMATVTEGKMVWTIVGVVDDEVVVRLEETPFPFDGPNLVCGRIVDEEDELIGNSLAEVIMPAHLSLTELNGMILENFKQSIDAFWIIKKTAILEKQPGGGKMNVAGGVLYTNDDPNRVASRVEQPKVASDMYTMDAMLRQNGRDRGGQSSIAMGQGDRAAETLGEANMAATQAILRHRDRLKTFEETFIEPLYRMRNQINMAMLDEEYVFGVLGEDKAMSWQVIDPASIRASVMFMCESSQRETNKAVIVQQMLQYAQVAPLALNAGQPVRIDRMLYDLGEMGFNVQQEKLKRYFPLVAMEEDQGIDVNMMLFQGAIQSMNQQSMGGAPPGEEMPQPKDEEQAQDSLMKKSAPPNVAEFSNV